MHLKSSSTIIIANLVICLSMVFAVHCQAENPAVEDFYIAGPESEIQSFAFTGDRSATYPVPNFNSAIHPHNGLGAVAGLANGDIAVVNLHTLNNHFDGYNTIIYFEYVISWLDKKNNKWSHFTPPFSRVQRIVSNPLTVESAIPDIQIKPDGKDAVYIAIGVSARVQEEQKALLHLNLKSGSFNSIVSTDEENAPAQYLPLTPIAFDTFDGSLFATFSEPDGDVLKIYKKTEKSDVLSFTKSYPLPFRVQDIAVADSNKVFFLSQAKELIVFELDEKFDIIDRFITDPIQIASGLEDDLLVLGDQSLFTLTKRTQPSAEHDYAPIKLLDFSDQTPAATYNKRIAVNTMDSVRDNIEAFAYHSTYNGPGVATAAQRVDQTKPLARATQEPKTLDFSNVINTANGITGVVFTIHSLANKSIDQDFLSKNLSYKIQVSPQGVFDIASNPPYAWATGPAPIAVTLLPGSDNQILFQWADNSIVNRWVRIKIYSNSNLSLPNHEMFYLGHLLGETTGLDNNLYTVRIADLLAIRQNLAQSVDVSNITDIDKDGFIRTADIMAARKNLASQLSNITISRPVLCDLDLNWDGHVSFADINIAKKLASKLATENSVAQQADVNTDGIVSVLDMAMIHDEIGQMVQYCNPKPPEIMIVK